MLSTKLKWLAWIAGAVVASAVAFVLVTEIYPAIHAWRLKMQHDEEAAAAQRDQARVQSEALTDTQEALRARGRAVRQSSPQTEPDQTGPTKEEIAKYADRIAEKCRTGQMSDPSVCPR